MVDSLLEPSRPQKRKRTIISCTECHRRKQKCDRVYPCGNCIKREKQDLCLYDVSPMVCRSTQRGSYDSGPSVTSTTSIMHLCLPPGPSSESASEIENKIRDFGYSNQSNHNSRSLLRTTNFYGGLDTSMLDASHTKPTFRSDAYPSYCRLVRHLPSHSCVDALIQTFFANVNWQYVVLDERPFREQLKEWRTVSYSNLQAGIERLAPTTLVFPALLFQVLAQALLFHSPDDKSIDSLMTMADMTFHDLAAEYSATGADILQVLGKEHITIGTVQAGLLRASFLKSNGKVVEAWHTLGATIRDAQEIGLHTGRVSSERSSTEPEPERQTNSTVCHRIWIVLHIWDVHMAVVLGRPIATSLQIDNFARSIEEDHRRTDLFMHWKTETSPPRPFDVILAGYNVAYRYFQDIYQLELNGAKLEDYHVVERIHDAIKENLGLLPSWCSVENPNPKFDQMPGCQWLPAAREGLTSLIYLVLLTLHRPYIFSMVKSRTEALKAGIAILHAQERLFRLSESHQCKVFNPVYASFDAIVLIAAICLVFPSQHSELRRECFEVVENGMQRLDTIGQFNLRAKSAHDVVQSLYRRLSHQVGISGTVECTDTVSSNSHHTSATSTGPPLELSFDDVLPPRPTYDLFYDNISSASIPMIDTMHDAPLDLPTNIASGWNFEGNFSDASFWSLMNELEY